MFAGVCQTNEDDMTDLIIAPTSETPSICCNAREGTVQITGNSTIADVDTFYAPLLNWLETFPEKTVVEIRLDSCNGETLGFFYLHLFAVIRKKRTANVIWYYDKTTRGYCRLLLSKAQDDDDPDCNVMFRCNFSYQGLFGFPIVFRKVKKDEPAADVPDLFIEATNRTPSIHGKKTCDGIEIEIKGRSVPEDAIQLYYQLFDWLRFYEDEDKTVCVNIRFEYYNTATSRCLMLLFERLEEMRGEGANPMVNWYTDGDEDMADYGMDFKDCFKLNFYICGKYFNHH